MARIHVHKKVKEIQFSVLSPQIIKKMATAKIVTPELYDKEGYPVDGGLMDIRMGVIDPGLTCKTCGLKLKECLGHPGYLELARPVVHINFVSTVLALLRASCEECGRILVSPKDIASQKRKLNMVEKERGAKEKKAATKRLLAKIRTAKKCPHCSAKITSLTLEKPSRFILNRYRWHYAYS